MLWRYELKKTLFTQKGLWILIICLILKGLFLSWFPEQKDTRIILSQKQYDKFLAQLHGEDTPEKSAWILSEYENYKQTIDMWEDMKDAYSRREITEEEWNTYAQALNQAELRINSATIFAEKAEQFAEQSQELPPAHYIYEYGWQTVYTLLQFPDIFLLFGLLILTAQCFSAEAAGGMLPVLLAARNGRRRLYGAKLLALLTVALAASIVFAGLEVMIFLNRGWCNDPASPLYSITLLTGCPLELSLMGGYLLCLAVRAVATLLFATMLFGLSVWMRNTTNLIFLGLCILLLPLLWNHAEALYTHSGLLSGTKVLLWRGETSTPLPVHLAVVVAYSFAIVILAARRHRRGL